jgi:diadenosine tetraphosphate (Ap4A) HIT family hydrolase
LTRAVADPNDPCLACAIVRGEVRPAGGVIWRGHGFVVHGLADPSPLRGWLVVSSERHVRALDHLAEAELARLGPLARPGW